MAANRLKAGNLAEAYLERYTAMVNARLGRYGSPYVVESQPAMLEGYGRVPGLVEYPGGRVFPFPGSLRLDLGLSDTRQLVRTPAVSEDVYPTLLRGYDITLDAAKVDAAAKYDAFGVKIRDIRPRPRPQ